MRPQLSRTAIARIAEKRIREAIAASELENLPGLGKPIPGIDEPYDPLWRVKGWMKRIAEEHGLAPAAVSGGASRGGHHAHPTGEAADQGKPTLEGAGAHLRRAFGFRDPGEFDPFLLLDDFRNDRNRGSASPDRARRREPRSAPAGGAAASNRAGSATRARVSQPDDFPPRRAYPPRGRGRPGAPWAEYQNWQGGILRLKEVDGQWLVEDKDEWTT